jgi:hypothetical protein
MLSSSNSPFSSTSSVAVATASLTAPKGLLIAIPSLELLCNHLIHNVLHPLAFTYRA